MIWPLGKVPSGLGQVNRCFSSCTMPTKLRSRTRPLAFAGIEFIIVERPPDTWALVDCLTPPTVYVAVALTM